MKLYATTTSERATKGQGGNDYLYLEVVNEFKQPLLTVKIVKGIVYAIPNQAYQMTVRNWIENKETKTLIKGIEKAEKQKTAIRCHKCVMFTNNICDKCGHTK
jgi:hypothetical protein